MVGVWKDKEKRLAFVVSLLLHSFAFFALELSWEFPETVPLENFLVIDVSAPALTEIEQEDLGESQSFGELIPLEEPSVTLVPDLSPQVDVVNPIDVTTEVAVSTITASPIPTPSLDVQIMPLLDLATEVNVDITELTNITTTVTAVTTSAVAIPEPIIEPTVVAERTIPVPNNEVALRAEVNVPLPNVEVNSGQTLAIPQPSINAETLTPREILIQATANTSLPQGIPIVNATANVTMLQTIPTPNNQVTLSQAQTIPQPGINAETLTAREVSIQATVTTSSPQNIPIITATPIVTAPQVVPMPNSQVTLSQAQTISTPTIQASVQLPQETEPAPREETQQTATPINQSTTQIDQQNQTEEITIEATETTQTSNLEGNAAERTPYREQRQQAITALLENTTTAPNGLQEASMIFELPIATGQTQLLAVYNKLDANTIGPLASSKKYFDELSQELNAVLIHNNNNTSTNPLQINPTSNPNLFSNTNNQQYSNGKTLRQELVSQNQNNTWTISGTLYRPAASAANSTELSIQYTSGYTSSFTYLSNLNSYKWQRNNQTTNSSTEDTLVTAVVTAKTLSVPTSSGELFIPLKGGPAQLFLRGKVINGSWQFNRGFKFTDENQELIELSAYKIWVLFVPQDATQINN